MSTVNWADHIKSSIVGFRKQFDALSEEEKSLLARDGTVRPRLMPTKPCQVIALDFVDCPVALLLVVHNKDYPDLDIAVLENPSRDKFSPTSLNEVPIWQAFGGIDAGGMVEQIGSMSSLGHSKEFEWGWMPYKKSIIFALSKNPPLHLDFFSNSMFEWVKRSLKIATRREEIGETVGDIKRDAQAIPTIELRTKIIEATEKLEREIGDLNKKVDEQIGGVRKMIGNSTEFQDFRVFTSDVSDLKKSHVPKDVFEAKMGELTARIDSLSDIRNAYDKVLGEQTEFMKQQASVMSQQSDFMKWVKYATILLPVAVISVPVIEIVSVLIKHLLGVQ